MNILGLSTMTESAAVLIRDGELVAAAEEERFSRVKHQGGIPYAAIESVLDIGNAKMRDIDTVAVYWDPYKLGFRLRWMSGLAVRHPIQFARKLRRAASVWQGAHTSGADGGWAGMFNIGGKLKNRFGSAPRATKYVDHHQTHMAASFYGSEFEEAAILIMDGAGEAVCTTTGVGHGAKMEIIDEFYLPHSLGHFYSAITGYLGFKMLDGEYKLMGLSPYGDPSGARWIRENYLVTPVPGSYRLVTSALDYHQALRGQFAGSFADHFGPPRPQDEDAEFNDRHRDIAASAQAAFEDVVIDLAKNLRQRTRLDKLVIAGGCGLNCVANGQILRHGIFDEIYVPPVPHDAGGALGAALHVQYEETGRRPPPINHALYGPQFTDDQVRSVLQANEERVLFQKLEFDDLAERTARSLADGGVIAWFQGALEYGPRALGNRSFLADPRSDGIRDVINAKIKKRELFRPFAPSVKVEKASEYFEISQAAPFMTIIVPVRESARSLIPAVTHVDGTARPQTVAKETNPRYWTLLDKFESLTGIPVLLNTSFNIQEPIVCTPQEAINTFCNSTTDALVLNDFWVTHK